MVKAGVETYALATSATLTYWTNKGYAIESFSPPPGWTAWSTWMGLPMNSIIDTVRQRRPELKFLIVAFACIVLSTESIARSVPVDPTSSDDIVLTVGLYDYCEMASKDPANSIRVESFVITYVFASACSDLPPAQRFFKAAIDVQFRVGRLPPGTYEIKAPDKLFRTNMVARPGDDFLVVRAADDPLANPNAIPATHPLALWIKSGLLLWIAWARLRYVKL
jgi:hypothetical protein